MTARLDRRTARPAPVIRCYRFFFSMLNTGFDCHARSFADALAEAAEIVRFWKLDDTGPITLIVDGVPAAGQMTIAA